MPRYVVRFVKDVLGENGRQAEICQSSMEIDAKDNLDAAELAKKNSQDTGSAVKGGRRFSVLNPVISILSKRTATRP